MYKLLLKLTESLGIIGYCACIIMSNSRKLFFRILFAKMRTTSCILQRYTFLEDSNSSYDDLLSTPFIITHAQRNITSAASRANDMLVYDR